MACFLSSCHQTLCAAFRHCSDADPLGLWFPVAVAVVLFSTKGLNHFLIEQLDPQRFICSISSKVFYEDFEKAISSEPIYERIRGYIFGHCPIAPGYTATKQCSRVYWFKTMRKSRVMHLVKVQLVYATSCTHC